VRAIVTDVLYKVNISTLEKTVESKEFHLNDIGCIRIRCASPIFFDPYSKNRTTGSFILVDEQSNNTVAAGMIIKSLADAGDEDAEVAI
jgi:sulfate adenylyltransferase subunit 1 (EFTu-like GTPase family)